MGVICTNLANELGHHLVTMWFHQHRRVHQVSARFACRLWLHFEYLRVFRNRTWSRRTQTQICWTTGGFYGYPPPFWWISSCRGSKAKKVFACHRSWDFRELQGYSHSDSLRASRWKRENPKKRQITNHYQKFPRLQSHFEITCPILSSIYQNHF